MTVLEELYMNYECAHSKPRAKNEDEKELDSYIENVISDPKVRMNLSDKITTASIWSCRDSFIDGFKYAMRIANEIYAEKE